VAALVSGEADYFAATAFPVRAAIQGLPLKRVHPFAYLKKND
jgi:hypothetical protein